MGEHKRKMLGRSIDSCILLTQPPLDMIQLATNRLMKSTTHSTTRLIIGTRSSA